MMKMRLAMKVLGRVVNSDHRCGRYHPHQIERAGKRLLHVTRPYKTKIK